MGRRRWDGDVRLPDEVLTEREAMRRRARLLLEPGEPWWVGALRGLGALALFVLSGVVWVGGFALLEIVARGLERLGVSVRDLMTTFMGLAGLAVLLTMLGAMGLGFWRMIAIRRQAQRPRCSQDRSQ